jgi:hypothetical protein
MDTSRYARFLRPGHRVTGDRSARAAGCAPRRGSLRLRAGDRRRRAGARLLCGYASRSLGTASDISRPSRTGPRTNGKVERFHQTMARELGLRAQLPRTPTTQPSAATLARPLQPPATTQLDQRLVTDQPPNAPAQTRLARLISRWQRLRETSPPIDGRAGPLLSAEVSCSEAAGKRAPHG